MDVLTAEEMYQTALTWFPECDGAVMCAAVADYTPVEVADTKIKKQDREWTLTLHQTHDIAAELGRIKEDRLLVGFALETDHEQENAAKKLQKKSGFHRSKFVGRSWRRFRSRYKPYYDY